MPKSAFRKRLSAVLAAGLIAFGPSSVRAGDIAAVVELFTSQGCSSCPPADALLSELAKRPEVLALSEHIDYWDHLGWKDPFANAENTLRQRAYAKLFGLHYVYTPQLVVNGDRQYTGSDRGKVLQALAGRLAPLPIDVRIDGDAAHGRQVRISGAGHPPERAHADVWLFLIDAEHRTEVAAGENAGRSLRNSNIVRKVAYLGSWQGDEVVMPIDAGGETRGLAGAVVVQDRDTGRILGAGRWQDW